MIYVLKPGANESQKTRNKKQNGLGPPQTRVKKTRNKKQETKLFSTFAVSRLRDSETKKKHCLIRESSF